MDTLKVIDKYVDRDTLAAHLRISKRTLWRYENLPDGIPSLMIGGRKHYPVAAVEEWFNNRVKRPNPTRPAKKYAA